MTTPEIPPASLEDWTRAAAKSAPAGDVRALNWVTPDGIEVKPLYTAQDLQGLPYTGTLPGFSQTAVLGVRVISTQA